MNEISAKIIDIIETNQDIRILFLQTNITNFNFKAGQYINITFEDFPSRPYSIACAPNKKKLLEIHVKDSGMGGLSTHIVKNIKSGATLNLTGPFGYCTLDKEQDKPLLLIAGGLGISPIKAILEEALQTERSYPIHLYWGTREEKEQYIKNYFDSLNKQHKHFYFTSVVGKTVGEAVTQDIKNLSRYNIYLAGSSQMVEATVPLLINKGAQIADIHTDNHAPSLHSKAKGS